MATRAVETGGSGSRRLRAICALAACVLLGLGLWRGAGVFTKPADASLQLSKDQRTLMHVIEPLAGSGNVRATIRNSGERTRDILILIDTTGGDARTLANDIEAILVTAVGFNSDLGDTLTVREFPFADGAAGQPAPSELAEIGIIGVLVFLLSWGAFAPQRSTPEFATSRVRSKRAAEERPQRTRPVAVDLTRNENSKTASAAKTASDDPARTAKIIRAWMRSPEG